MNKHQEKVAEVLRQHKKLADIHLKIETRNIVRHVVAIITHKLADLYEEEDNTFIGIRSWELAEFMHNTYEESAKMFSWGTQDKCKVEYEKLPLANRKTMIRTAVATIDYFNKKLKPFNRKAFLKRCGVEE